MACSSWSAGGFAGFACPTFFFCSDIQSLSPCCQMPGSYQMASRQLECILRSPSQTRTILCLTIQPTRCFQKPAWKPAVPGLRPAGLLVCSRTRNPLYSLYAPGLQTHWTFSEDLKQFCQRNMFTKDAIQVFDSQIQITPSIVVSRLLS